jgi:hypothetical protein
LDIRILIFVLRKCWANSWVFIRTEFRKYCDMSAGSRNSLISRDGCCEAMTLQTHFHGYQVTWLRPLLHTREEHVTSASPVTSPDNRGVVEAVFSVGSVQMLYLENPNTCKSVRVDSSEKSRESLQADRPVRFWGYCETVAPGGGVGDGGSPIVLSRCLATPSWLWVSHRSLRTWTRMLRKLWRGEPLQYNRWRHSRLRRINVCSSKFQNVWISDSAVVTCNSDLQESIKSDSQSKLCV